MFQVFWYRITRMLYYKQRDEWLTKAVQYQPYVEFMSSTSNAAYWMKLSHRERVILMEFMLGVALGRFTDKMVLSYVDFFTERSYRLL
jgi:hypothetical protein